MEALLKSERGKRKSEIRYWKVKTKKVIYEIRYKKKKVCGQILV